MDDRESTWRGRRAPRLTTFSCGLLLLLAVIAAPPGAPEETRIPETQNLESDPLLLGLQHAYLQMNQELRHRVAQLGAEPTPEEAIEITRLALEHREKLLHRLDLGPAAMLFAQQHRNLDLSADLLELMDQDHSSKLHAAVEIAQRATQWQAASLELAWGEPIPLQGHKAPSTALLQLADRHGTQPDAETLARIQALDEISSPLRSVIARFVDAFLAFDTAARDAYTNAPPDLLDRDRADLEGEALRWLESEPLNVPSSGDRFKDQGIDLSRLLPSRNQFLDAVLELKSALEEHPTARQDTCDPIQLSPAFSIDLAHCDNVYTEHFALVLDAGGSDTYHNNAGGNGLGPECTVDRAAAALVDLGEGDDVVGDPQNPLSCGSNGGGAIGAGFLLNEQGNNRYTAGDTGTNGGGAFFGTGFLLDVAGNDEYLAGGFGTNGGAYNIGLGMLIDLEGDNLFAASQRGTNGGGDVHGIGLLVSGGGDDAFITREGGVWGNGGVNGGGAVFGVGALVSRAGNNIYDAAGSGSNGGAFLGGTGFLFDAGGDDTYDGGIRGANGGAFGAGLGLLLDVAGNDAYRAGGSGTNGGSRGSVLAGFNLPAIGLLLDLNGDDSYMAESRGTNGGSDGVLGLGLLLDGDGDDYYDDDVASCWDCSLLPKGLLGAQVDSDDV